MFIINETVSSIVCGEGVNRKILARGGNLMMVEVKFKKDAVGIAHAHPHEQVSYIANGSFEFTIENETQVVNQGDSIYIHPNKIHSTKAREENSIIIDVFSPQREDFL